MKKLCIAVIIALLFSACQKTAEEKAARRTEKPAVVEVPEKDAMPETPEKDESAISCGLEAFEDGEYCVCGNTPLKRSEAALWECVDREWLCYKKDGCPLNGEIKAQASSFETEYRCKDFDCACGKNRCGKHMLCRFGRCICGGDTLPGSVPDSACVEKKTVPKERYKQLEDEGFVALEEKGFIVIDGVYEGSCRYPYRIKICDKKEGCDKGYAYREFACLDNGKISDGVLCGDIVTEEIVDAFPDLRPCFDKHCSCEDYEGNQEDCDYGRDFGCIGIMPFVGQYTCDDKEFLCRRQACGCFGEFCLKGEICSPEGCRCAKPGCSAERKCQGEKTRCENGHRLCVRSDGEKEPAPRNDTGYVCRPLSDFPDAAWQCASDDGCVCGEEKIPEFAYCHHEKALCGSDTLSHDPKGYECTSDGRWHCESNEGCVCDAATCPQFSYCAKGLCTNLTETMPGESYRIYKGNDDFWQCDAESCACGKNSCHRKEICVRGKCHCPSDLRYDKLDTPPGEGYVCDGEKWLCSGDCKCGNKTCPKNAEYRGKECYCNDELSPGDAFGECDEAETCGKQAWICTQDACSCYGVNIDRGDCCNRDRFDKDEIAKLSDPRCPQNTGLYNEQCIFPDTKQIIAPDTSGYREKFGYPLCVDDKGCACGKKTCAKEHYCIDNICTPSLFYAETAYGVLPVHSVAVSKDVYGGEQSIGRSYEKWPRHDVYYDDVEAAFLPYSENNDKDDEERLVPKQPRIVAKDYGKLLPELKRKIEIEDYEIWLGTCLKYREVCGNTETDAEDCILGFVCADPKGCACGDEVCNRGEACTDDGCLTVYEQYEVDAYNNYVPKESVVTCTEDSCECGSEKCVKNASCVTGATGSRCRFDGDYILAACPSENRFRVTVDELGRCRSQYLEHADPDYHIVPPYQYRFVEVRNIGILGYRCDAAVCDCGDKKCRKDAFCVSPGRCVSVD